MRISGNNSLESFEDWVPDETNRYFEVTHHIPDKEFVFVCRADLDKKTWVCVYQNPLNPKECWIRSEVQSPTLWAHRRNLTKDQFIEAINKVIRNFYAEEKEV